MNEYDKIWNINSEVNLSVTYKTDLEQYSKLEHWEVAGKFGDCEDYALLKRERLIAIGFEKSKLHLACCWTELNEYHCVLIVETNNGVFVLDNRYAQVKTPSELPYRWHKAWQNGLWREISF